MPIHPTGTAKTTPATEQRARPESNETRALPPRADLGTLTLLGPTGHWSEPTPADSPGAGPPRVGIAPAAQVSHIKGVHRPPCLFKDTLPSPPAHNLRTSTRTLQQQTHRRNRTSVPPHHPHTLLLAPKPCVGLHQDYELHQTGGATSHLHKTGGTTSIAPPAKTHRITTRVMSPLQGCPYCAPLENQTATQQSSQCLIRKLQQNKN